MSFDVLLVCGSLQQRSANRAALDVARVHLQGSPRARASYSRELGDVPPFNWDHRDHEVAALSELRDDPRYGPKLACLEAWLHRPQPEPADLDALLAEREA